MALVGMQGNAGGSIILDPSSAGKALTTIINMAATTAQKQQQKLEDESEDAKLSREKERVALEREKLAIEKEKMAMDREKVAIQKEKLELEERAFKLQQQKVASKVIALYLAIHTTTFNRITTKYQMFSCRRRRRMRWRMKMRWRTAAAVMMIRTKR